MLSVLFCFLSILFLGFGCFMVNWRAYLDEQNTWNPEQPLAVSIILACLGNFIAMTMLSVIWPWRPLVWIKWDAAFASWMAGVLISFGASLWIISADQGLPADIGGPVTGLRNLVPPLWYWLYTRKCIAIKTALGFTLSIVSLFLYSGLLSESISYTPSSSEWLVLAMNCLVSGMAIVIQANSVTDIKFQQFPQIQICFGVGFTCCSIVIAFIISISDVFDPLNYKPFGVDQYLMIGSELIASCGEGFFFVCLAYANDVSLMVALSSLNITVPAVFGVLLLDEPATWNIILGLLSALAAMIVLSMEVNEEVEDAEANSTYSMRILKPIVKKVKGFEHYSTIP